MEERTEQPTTRRLRKAREDGDSGASAPLSQAAGFGVAVALVPAAASALAARAATELRAVMSVVDSRPSLATLDFVPVAADVSAIVLPLLLGVALAGSVVQAIQTGGVISTKRLTPKLERLDPVAGLRGLFSGQRLFSVVRALATAVVVAAVARQVLLTRAVDLVRLVGRARWVGMVVRDAAGSLAWQVALVGAAFAVGDVLVARRAWLARWRMTKEEVRREQREAEGDPQVKAARERAHRELVAQATLAGVREASVVVVNPTHLACALRYDEGRGDEAPVVVARGEGESAARIVRVAAASGVPIVHDVPLARALVELEVGGSIPEALYEAVAAILRELV